MVLRAICGSATVRGAARGRPYRWHSTFSKVVKLVVGGERTTLTLVTTCMHDCAYLNMYDLTRNTQHTHTHNVLIILRVKTHSEWEGPSQFASRCSRMSPLPLSLRPPLSSLGILISLPTFSLFSSLACLSPGSSSKPRYPCNTKATAAPDRCPSTLHAVTVFSRPRTSEVGCLPTVSSPLAQTRHRPPPQSGGCGSPGPPLVDPR